MKPMSISFDDKPNLTRALGENRALATEVIKTFISLMEESFDDTKGVMWADLPKQLHKDLTFKDMVRGVVKGALDLKGINPDAFETLKAGVHPLSLLQSRKNMLDGGMIYSKWRQHFAMPEDSPIDEDSIAAIIQKLLRYSKYVKVADLQRALESNQLAVHRGIGHEQVAKLPFVPALRYQQREFGDLRAGKFYDEIGFFDCGELVTAEEDCPACSHSLTELGKYRVCLACNAGYEVKAL